MNRYLPYINLNTYNSYHVRVNALKSMGGKPMNDTFRPK